MARLTRLPEANSVTNHADSVNFELTSIQSDSTVIAKPLVLSSTLPSRKDIQTYVAKAGDSVDSIAAQFGVSSDSVRWSNSLNGNGVAAGSTLHLPPPAVNGIVYTVKSGDTVESIARKYNTSADLVVAYNDTEIKGLPFGERIIVPNGSIITAAPAVVSRGTSFLGSYAPSYGGNGYDYGWCTWGVANKISVPNNWGNANTWDNFAARSGWTVSNVPIVGAVGQSDRGWAGHVGVVTEVSPDGSQIKYLDMNGLAGWGRYGYSDWVPTHSAFQKFIYR